MQKYINVILFGIGKMITAKQMKILERNAQKKGIFAKDLMENAGREVFRVVKEKHDLDGKHVMVFAGSGNNGGDGFVAARYFSDECPVVILLFGDPEKSSEEAKDNYERIKEDVNIVQIKSKADLDLFQVQEGLDLIIIDALLGTGVKGQLRDPVSLAIDYFNSLHGVKVAVDLPSGLDPDTGEVHDKSCNCDLIITFHDLKYGLEKFKKKTIVVDIGIPGSDIGDDIKNGANDKNDDVIIEKA